MLTMPTYQPGDYVKVEFAGEAGMSSEWMWVKVRRCDDQKKLVFGTLDNEPLNDYGGRLTVGSELTIAYAQIREHRRRNDSLHA